MNRASVVIFAEQFPAVFDPEHLAGLSGASTLEFAIIRRGVSCRLSGAVATCDQVASLLKAELVNRPVDINVITHTGMSIKALLSDMDSTVITTECMDEMADYAGIGDKIRKITQRAMNGELDFTESLHERLKLIAGLKESDLESIWREQIILTPGARSFVETLSKRDVETVLISGGFTWFASRVAAACGFSTYHANVLEMRDGVLTGHTEGNILSADTKLDVLNRYADTLPDGHQSIMAIGDGANDLPMLKAAGLGVAYKAHDVVRAAIPIQINHHGLDCALDLVEVYQQA